MSHTTHRPILIPIAVLVTDGIRQRLQDGWAINTDGMLVFTEDLDEPVEEGAESPPETTAISRDVDVTRIEDVIRAESSRANFVSVATGGGESKEYAKSYLQAMSKGTFVSNYLIHRLALVVTRLANNEEIFRNVNISSWEEKNQHTFIEALARTKAGYLEEIKSITAEMHREIWPTLRESNLRRDGFGMSADKVEEAKEAEDG